MKRQLRFQVIDIFSDEGTITFPTEKERVSANPTIQPKRVYQTEKVRGKVRTAHAVPGHSSDQAIQPGAMGLSLLHHDLMSLLQHLVYCYQRLKRLDLVG